jgi:uncharacterized damage-inducible protein DinB
MDRLDTIRSLWRFHAWARPRALEASRVASDGLRIPGVIAGGLGTGSVHDMLGHIVGAEELWLSRWKGDPEATLPSGDAFADLETLGARWDAVERERADFLSSLTEEDLDEVVPYVSVTRQVRERFPLGMTLLHLSNHTTHHRAEAVEGLTRLGHATESVDFIDYLREAAASEE